MKKITKVIITIVIVILIGIIGIKGKEYYEDRYVGSDYYLQVPTNQDTTPEMLYSDNGKEMWEGKDYELIAYNQNGETKIVKFTLSFKDGLLQPDDYVKVEVSKQIVLGQKVISREEIPEKALNCIDENH